MVASAAEAGAQRKKKSSKVMKYRKERRKGGEKIFQPKSTDT